MALVLAKLKLSAKNRLSLISSKRKHSLVSYSNKTFNFKNNHYHTPMFFDKLSFYEKRGSQFSIFFTFFFFALGTSGAFLNQIEPLLFQNLV